jgi:hypothetical protein
MSSFYGHWQMAPQFSMKDITDRQNSPYDGLCLCKSKEGFGGTLNQLCIVSLKQYKQLHVLL